MQRLYFLLIRKLPGQFYLWCAIIIFGAANSVTRKLTEIGAQKYVMVIIRFHFVMFYLWGISALY